MKKENVVVNVVTCPPCGESTAKSGVRGAYKATSLISPSIGPADHFLRKGGRKGFTLIELLVVVLIVGILAAVAVAQYRLAVEKSRIMQVVGALKAIYQAEELYYLAHGTYSPNQADLDINVVYAQAPKGWAGPILPSQSQIDNTLNYRTAQYQHKTYSLSVTQHFYHGDYPGQLMCWANSSDQMAQRICESVGKTQISSQGGGKRWLIY